MRNIGICQIFFEDQHLNSCMHLSPWYIMCSSNTIYLIIFLCIVLLHLNSGSLFWMFLVGLCYFVLLLWPPSFCFGGTPLPVWRSLFCGLLLVPSSGIFWKNETTAFTGMHSLLLSVIWIGFFNISTISFGVKDEHPFALHILSFKFSVNLFFLVTHRLGNRSFFCPFFIDQCNCFFYRKNDQYIRLVYGYIMLMTLTV